jgi:hypothetical protein
MLIELLQDVLTLLLEGLLLTFLGLFISFIAPACLSETRYLIK